MGMGKDMGMGMGMIFESGYRCGYSSTRPTPIPSWGVGEGRSGFGILGSSFP